MVLAELEWTVDSVEHAISKSEAGGGLEQAKLFESLMLESEVKQMLRVHVPQR